jgi:sugar phosphate isomerase/epimerase
MSASAMKSFVDRSNSESSKFGLPNLLIMVDGEGMLSTPDDDARKKAVKNHVKWIEAAADMGCHSIRVNLNGSDEAESWKKASVESLKALSDLAAPSGINILVENHGGLSSNGALHAEVMKEVGMDNCGTLPDFGNFCIAYDDDRQCTGHYDKYRGMRELLPYAKAISAKSHRFSPDGQEVDIDYQTMLLLIKNSGYTGYISVEYEGDGLTEEAGILATKKLLETSAASLA